MSGRINTYRNAVVAAIKAKLPELASCESQFGRFNLDELQTTMVRAPAVRFAVLSSKVTYTGSGHGDAAMSCAAFVVTEGKDRDAKGWNIAEAIGAMLQPPCMFGLVKISEPSNVSIQPVVSLSLKNRGVSIIAVEFSQTLRGIAADLFDDSGNVISQFYVNDELMEVDGNVQP
jgi:hypothetical protein